MAGLDSKVMFVKETAFADRPGEGTIFREAVRKYNGISVEVREIDRTNRWYVCLHRATGDMVNVPYIPEWGDLKVGSTIAIQWDLGSESASTRCRWGSMGTDYHCQADAAAGEEYCHQHLNNE